MVRRLDNFQERGFRCYLFNMIVVTSHELYPLIIDFALKRHGVSVALRTAIAYKSTTNTTQRAKLIKLKGNIRATTWLRQYTVIEITSH